MISVIIPIFNDQSALRKCLDAMRLQTLSPDEFEVLVVDNGSRQSPAALVDEYQFARCLEEAVPGSYNARNAGAKAAAGDLLAFTDADCIPAPDWLERGRSHFAFDPSVAAIGGRIDLKVSGQRTGAELFEAVFPPFLQRQYIEQMGFAATANLMVRRADFLSVGLFDGARLSSGDKEWGRRFVATGRKLTYAPDVVVSHPARRSIAALIQKQRRVVGGRIAGPGKPGAVELASWRKRIRTDMRGTLTTLLFSPDRLALSRTEALKVVGVGMVVASARAMESIRLRLGAAPAR